MTTHSQRKQGAAPVAAQTLAVSSVTATTEASVAHATVEASADGWLERVMALLLVAGVHIGLVWWIASGLVQPPPPVEAPALIGSLVAPPAAVVPEPPPPPPMLAPPPKPVPPAPPPAVKPPPKAPPSERAVSLPPPPPPAPVVVEPEAVAPPAEPAPVVVSSAPQAPDADNLPVTPPRSSAAHLNNPAPVYPRVSRRLREEGRVLLDVYILPDGSVGEIKLKRSSGFERLDQAALDSVRRWRFVPARRGDEAIAYWYVQPLDFALDT